MAASAGIQFGDLQTEAFRLREKLGPDHQKAYYEIIRQLARGGAVSEAEQRALLELGKRGFAVGSDREAEKFVAYVQGLHKRMLADRSASPVALAIIGAIATMRFLPTLVAAAEPWRERQNIRSVTSC